MWQSTANEGIPPGYLVPVAYLWTRTVRCKNPLCGATVPLVRQTWLCKKKDRYVALRMIAPKGEKKVRFQVVESRTEKGLGFDPAGFSKAGNATCPFCGTVADSDYVKAEGCAKRMGQQMMAIVCTRPGRQGKVYLSADDLPSPSGRGAGGEGFLPDDEAIRARIEALYQRTGLTVPSEPIANLPADCRDNSLGITVRPYGLRTWGDLFTPRQMLCLLTFSAAVREAVGKMPMESAEVERARGIVSTLGCGLDRMADQLSTLVAWLPTLEAISHTFPRQALPMVWDFVETNPLGDAGGSWKGAVDWVGSAISHLAEFVTPLRACVSRGSATALPWSDGSFDAVITDPPYYDNIQYAALSDFFYVWLKRTIGHLYPEHFGTELSPKKNEAVASPWRHKKQG